MKEKPKKNIFAAFYIQPHKFKGLDYNFSKIFEITAPPPPPHKNKGSSCSLLSANIKHNDNPFIGTVIKMYLLVAMTYLLKLKDIPNPKQLPVEERLCVFCTENKMENEFRIIMEYQKDNCISIHLFKQLNQISNFNDLNNNNKFSFLMSYNKI